MPERAQVTSLEAIETFRAKLLIFMTKTRAALEEAADEAQRTQSWLENEKRPHWEHECRRRARELDEVQQELFSAKVSRIQTKTAAQLLAVERAKRALREAEEKRDNVRRWVREFSNRADPLVKQVEQFLGFVTTDLVKAAAHLRSVLRTLDAYMATRPEGSSAPPASTGTLLADPETNVTGASATPTATEEASS
jgi:hypothetical protein